jgi:hypothetical protein
MSAVKATTSQAVEPGGKSKVAINQRGVAPLVATSLAFTSTA